MYRGKKIVVVMPAYNAARTLAQTYAEVREQGLVDTIILVDDGSRDETVAVARQLEGVQVHVHERNRGYGANQKTCYRLALEAGADIVVMIHPDYQYTPKLLPAMVSMIANGLHPCVLGSRILEIRGEPVSDLRGKPSARGQALRIPHRLSRLLARDSPDAQPGRQLRRFRFRQPDARPNPLARIHHRRGQLSDALFSGSVLDQPAPEHSLRTGLSGHGADVSAGAMGMDYFEAFPEAVFAAVASRFNALVRRLFLRLAVAQCTTPDLTALS
jgi:glycosyltransferase involved in cell wall biosynthesis